MSKAVFTLEDKGGEMAVSIDYGDEGVNKQSPAHKMTAILIGWMKDLDAMPTEAPKFVLAAEEINAAKAQQIAHLGSERSVIHAHSIYETTAAEMESDRRMQQEAVSRGLVA